MSGLLGATTIRDNWFAAREKAKDAATDAGKLGGYAIAIKRIQELMDHVVDVTTIEKAVIVLRAERDGLKFDLQIKKSEVAEAKGQFKKAREICIEAIVGLEHDETPDAYQRDLRSRGEARLAEIDRRMDARR